MGAESENPRARTHAHTRTHAKRDSTAFTMTRPGSRRGLQPPDCRSVPARLPRYYGRRIPESRPRLGLASPLSLTLFPRFCGRSSSPPANAAPQCPLERPRGWPARIPGADPRPRSGSPSRWRSLWSQHQSLTGQLGLRRPEAGEQGRDGTELETEDNSIPEAAAKRQPGRPPPSPVRPSLLPPAPPLPPSPPRSRGAAAAAPAPRDAQSPQQRRCRRSQPALPPPLPQRGRQRAGSGGAWRRPPCPAGSCRLVRAVIDDYLYLFLYF